MKKLTPYQKDEILALINIRRETVEDDIESATPFEAIPNSLDTLEGKIKSDDMNFSLAEIEWLVEEASSRKDMALSNSGNEGIKVLGLANSMQNIIDKIVSDFN